MPLARFLALFGLVFLMTGCRSHAPNSHSRQIVGPHAVVAFPVAVNGADKEVSMAVKFHSDGPLLDVYLVLDKDSQKLTDRLNNGQPAGDLELIGMNGQKVGTLLATVPANSGIHIVIRNRSEEQATVTWEMSN
jgi:hypothetical protein